MDDSALSEQDWDELLACIDGQEPRHMLTTEVKEDGTPSFLRPTGITKVAWWEKRPGEPNAQRA